jgi:hypothetical protein
MYKSRHKNHQLSRKDLTQTSLPITPLRSKSQEKKTKERKKRKMRRKRRKRRTKRRRRNLQESSALKDQ